jgi:hypothetical protein
MAAAMGDPLVQLRLAPAVVIAIALLIAMRIWDGPTPVLIVLFLSMVGYYAVMAALGIDHARAVELGLLPRVGESSTSALSLDVLGMIDWAAVAHTAPSIAAVVLLNLIGMLLNISGVELATGEDIDENRELRVTGAANGFWRPYIVYPKRCHDHFEQTSGPAHADDPGALCGAGGRLSCGPKNRGRGAYFYSGSPVDVHRLGDAARLAA